MELGLNLVWLLVAVGAVGAWCLSWTYQRHRTPTERLHELTALACALVFLFFAVSLSDDLHADAIVWDDCTTKRHYSLVWESCHSSHQRAEPPHISSLAAVPSRPLPPVKLQVSPQSIQPISSPARYSLDERLSFGRSPPLPFTS